MPEEIKADIKALLEEFGNTKHALPFYVLYPKGRPPVVISDAPILQGALINRLEGALAAEANEAQTATASPSPVTIQ